MADKGLNKRFFTNTYITGSGRHNYLRIDHLEDPLFTSFTFDIDYVTSPLFYTINYSDYGYPSVEGLAGNIEKALTGMYREYMSNDQGYDILPVLSASILDNNKLGFGLQQNVYMDMPLYGATEYIYMVDKRNGGASQNDVRFDSNRFLESGGNPNTLNNYKLGDSVKSVVNDSDKAWAERQHKQSEDQVKKCDEIMSDETVLADHTKNKDMLTEATVEYENKNKYTIVEKDENGKDVDIEYTEEQLVQKVDEYKKLSSGFEKLKKDISSWANGVISGYQSKGTKIYTSSKCSNCIQKIFSYDDLNESNKNDYAKKLENLFGEEFRTRFIYEGGESFVVEFTNVINSLITCKDDLKPFDQSISDDNKSFLLLDKDGCTIRNTEVINKFKDELTTLGLIDEENDNLKSSVMVKPIIECPEWAHIYGTHLYHFCPSDSNKGVNDMIKNLMSYGCDVDVSFDDKFTSDDIKKIEEMLAKYEDALDQIRCNLYGIVDGEICDKSNPSPDSPYGKYIAAKENLDNDDYSQAEKAKSVASGGVTEMNNIISNDEYAQSIQDENYNAALKMDAQPMEVNRNESIVASQTVLDMLGFISGMKKMTMDYPYIIQGITGLDTAYKNHYMVKDPYLGSGDDKITLTCLESLDLRVSSMFNRYFNAVYDRQYRRERVPVNLRRFNCSIYVHDVRNFVSKVRVDRHGDLKVTYNRILELTDMYYSVIEFRFYDCEIVPEETGNIFNDISNEAPSDMKKTNFTFTYGNCVVNFVPYSEVAAHTDNLSSKK